MQSAPKQNSIRFVPMLGEEPHYAMASMSIVAKNGEDPFLMFFAKGRISSNEAAFPTQMLIKTLTIHVSGKEHVFNNVTIEEIDQGSRRFKSTALGCQGDTCGVIDPMSFSINPHIPWRDEATYLAEFQQNYDGAIKRFHEMTKNLPRPASELSQALIKKPLIDLHKQLAILAVAASRT